MGERLTRESAARERQVSAKGNAEILRPDGIGTQNDTERAFASSRLEAEGAGGGAHGFDAEGDVLFEGDAELLGAADDVIAIDASRKSLVF